MTKAVNPAPSGCWSLDPISVRDFTEPRLAIFFWLYPGSVLKLNRDAKFESSFVDMCLDFLSFEGVSTRDCFTVSAVVVN